MRSRQSAQPYRGQLTEILTLLVKDSSSSSGYHVTDSMIVECQSSNKMIQFQPTTSWEYLSDFIIKTHIEVSKANKCKCSS